MVHKSTPVSTGFRAIWPARRGDGGGRLWGFYEAMNWVFCGGAKIRKAPLIAGPKPHQLTIIKQSHRHSFYPSVYRVRGHFLEVIMVPQRRMPNRVKTLPTLLLALAVMACHGPSGPSALLAEAREFHQKGENRAAIIQLKNALQQQPNNAEARALLGAVYLEAGDPLSAEKELHKAQTLGMAAPALAPQLAKAKLMQGQFEQVLADTAAVAGPAPSAELPAGQRFELQLLRANAYLGLGKLEPARKLFEQLRLQQPRAGAPLLGLARHALLSGQAVVAGTLAEQALARQPNDIDTLRLQGDLLSLRGDRKAAALMFQRILALQPENTQAHLDLANVYIQSGQFAAAHVQIDAARKSGPGKVLVAYGQALLDFREGNNKAARDALQQVLRVAPEHMPSVLLMGAVQLQLGADQQAGDYLRRFLETYPRHVYASKTLARLALKNHTPEVALDIVLPLLKATPNDAELLGIAGDAQMQAKRYADALHYFEQAAALAPASAQLRTALAASRLGLGDDARAIGDLERATALDGKQERAGVLLVMTHLRNNDTDRALAAATAMVQQQPGNPLVFNLQGGVLLARKEMKAARGSFDKALSLDPKYFPALDNLTQIDLAERKPLQARHRLETALALQRGNINIMLALSKLAAAQDDKAGAVGWLERACRENPDALAPTTVLSALYLQTGAADKAVALAQKFQSSHPEQADAMALLAQVQSDTGHYAAAIDSYLKLAVLQPASAALQLSIANLQMAQKDYPAALQSVKKALVLQPGLLEAEVAEVGLLLDARLPLQAAAAARGVQRRHPGLAAGYKLEADVLMAQGQPLAALTLYQQAYGISPGGPQMINIHQALMLAGKRDDANARLLAWLARHPADQAARLYLAGSYLRAQQYIQASEQYEKILQQTPGHAVALNDLAWTYQRARDPRALEIAERAARLAPRQPAVLDTLGWILLQQGQTARALPLLRQAAALAPHADEIAYHLSLALIQAGDKPAARQQLEQLLLASKDLPNRAEVQALLSKL